jgi:hypothetical protein
MAWMGPPQPPHCDALHTLAVIFGMREVLRRGYNSRKLDAGGAHPSCVQLYTFTPGGTDAPDAH